jgi:hypothetical protein
VRLPAVVYVNCRADQTRALYYQVNRPGAQSARAGLDWPAPESETWMEEKRGHGHRDGGATANISRKGGAGASEVVVVGRRTDAIESDWIWIWEFKGGEKDPGEHGASAPDGDGTCQRCTNFE